MCAAGSQASRTINVEANGKRFSWKLKSSQEPDNDLFSKGLPIY